MGDTTETVARAMSVNKNVEIPAVIGCANIYRPPNRLVALHCGDRFIVFRPHHCGDSITCDGQRSDRGGGAALAGDNGVAFDHRFTGMVFQNFESIAAIGQCLLSLARPVSGPGRIDTGRIFAHKSAIRSDESVAFAVAANRRDSFGDGMGGVIVSCAAEEGQPAGPR